VVASLLSKFQLPSSCASLTTATPYRSAAMMSEDPETICPAFALRLPRSMRISTGSWAAGPTEAGSYTVKQYCRSSPLPAGV